jgi:hypothetical protein
MKYLFLLIFILTSLRIFSQVPTHKYYERSQSDLNWINNCNFGKTSYQIDKSISMYLINQNGFNYNVYYYYVWFYNESYKNCNRSSTYIQTINIYIDGKFVGNYWLLITGDYSFITLYSSNYAANIRIEYSKPIPY